MLLNRIRTSLAEDEELTVFKAFRSDMCSARALERYVSFLPRQRALVSERVTFTPTPTVPPLVSFFCSK
jgi:hypothetical protein